MSTTTTATAQGGTGEHREASRRAPRRQDRAAAGAQREVAGSTLSVDEYGAPVTFAPARWLVCFVPGLRPQFWHRFVHGTHKHVLLLKPDMAGTWTLFEPWWTRLLVRTVSTDQALRFLTWAAMGDVLLVEEHVPGRGRQLSGWANCASLAAFVLGRGYWVWSPHALFRRLAAEPRTRSIDVSGILDPNPGAVAPTSTAGPQPTSPLNANLRRILHDLGWETDTMVSTIPTSNREDRPAAASIGH